MMVLITSVSLVKRDLKMLENNVLKVIELIDKGVKPVIKFLKSSETTHFDPRQQARVFSYHLDYSGDDLEDQVWIFKLDFSEFEKYNRSLALANFYDEYKMPTLKWHDTKYFPKDFKCDYFVGIASSDEFEIVIENELIEEFILSEETDYITWLENQLRSLKNEQSS